MQIGCNWISLSSNIYCDQIVTNQNFQFKTKVFILFSKGLQKSDRRYWSVEKIINMHNAWIES